MSERSIDSPTTSPEDHRFGENGPTLAEIQDLVELAASFNLMAASEDAHWERAMSGPASQVGPTGLETTLSLSRFHIDMPPASMGEVRAVNQVGEAVGSCRLRLAFIPHDHLALPSEEPPATPLDRSRSQRFSLQEAEFAIGDDGFRVFGTGRTLPMLFAGSSRTVIAAVGTLIEGFGRFAGREGAIVLSGDLDEHGALRAHVMVRIGDQESSLHRLEDLPAPQPAPEILPDSTYLSWLAQKRFDGQPANYFSMSPDGQPRGVNIPVNLHRLSIDMSTRVKGGFASRFEKGARLGLEIGYGRETRPRTPLTGTPLSPFPFEGVSKYAFYDSEGGTVAECTANFLEGRSFSVELEEAGGLPALRFGYYGVFVDGAGTMGGIRGLLYGLGRSVFDPVQLTKHVISNWYVARVADPEGRYRLPAGGPSER